MKTVYTPVWVARTAAVLITLPLQNVRFMKLCTVLSALFFFAVSSCLPQQPDFSWLKGTWKLEGKNVYEVWTGEGNNLKAKSFKVVGSDTVVLEKVTLRNEDGNYFYVPDVAENKGEVKFKMTTITRDGFIAENPDHDFPKIIRYTVSGKGKDRIINAAIEGNGKVISYKFWKF
jgi:hypothetical protein